MPRQHTYILLFDTDKYIYVCIYVNLQQSVAFFCSHFSIYLHYKQLFDTFIKYFISYYLERGNLRKVSGVNLHSVVVLQLKKACMPELYGTN